MVRYKHYESVRRIDHASPIKRNGNPKKEHRLSADEKCVELTETLTVEKKVEKVREIGTRITLRSSHSNGIFRSKMTITAKGCAGINVSCMNFTSIYVIGVIVIEQFNTR